MIIVVMLDISKHPLRMAKSEVGSPKPIPSNFFFFFWDSFFNQVIYVWEPLVWTKEFRVSHLVVTSCHLVITMVTILGTNKQPTENLRFILVKCKEESMKNFKVYKLVAYKFLVVLEVFPLSAGPSLHPIHPSFETQLKLEGTTNLGTPKLRQFTLKFWEVGLMVLKALENNSQHFVTALVQLNSTEINAWD